MLLGSEQVYVTIKLFNSYYSIFLTCTSFHSPIETLSNMLIVATKKRSDKIIYEIYNKSCSGFDKYWLKNSVFFKKNYKLTILSLKLTNMKGAISKC